MRNAIIAGNWKMYKTPVQAEALAREIMIGLEPGLPDAREVVLCPPAVDLAAVSRVIRSYPGVRAGLGAQNCYPAQEGAYTGETSTVMIRETGAEYVIVGHSERRTIFAETDGFINRKVLSCLEGSLKPILCVGESLEQREQGAAEKVIESQLSGGLKTVGCAHVHSVVIAYEPVWAIGTGKTATPDQAQEVHRFIRAWLAGAFNRACADKVRIQYGGSVKPENIAELMARPDIDGALVGGASLKAELFLAIVNY